MILKAHTFLRRRGAAPFLLCLAACLGACSGSDSSGPNSQGDTDSGGDDDSVTCEDTAVDGNWALSFADGVSVEYEVNLSPSVTGTQSQLRLLFERYGDQEYVGTFSLGTGVDSNFGNCAHCVYLPGTGPESAFLATEGTLITRLDPFQQRMDASMTGLRLSEITVSPFTRESTLVEDGRCIAVPDFDVIDVFPTPGWTCAADKYNDKTTCDCECGAVDPDCNTVTECPPFDPDCETSDPLPVVGCEAEELCVFEPDEFSLAGRLVCASSCDWQGRTECDSEACLYDLGSGAGDICVGLDDNRLDSAALGEACAESNLQLYCAVDEEGFPLGYCNTSNPGMKCSKVCDAQEDCEGPDTCRFFVGDEGLGYCGPAPADDG